MGWSEDDWKDFAILVFKAVILIAIGWVIFNTGGCIALALM